MQKYKCESPHMNDYLSESDEVDYSHESIQEQLQELLDDSMSDIEIIQRAYEFVRDEVSHSWDIQSTRVTRTASEVLKHKEGICYAKSNLLAALLRAKKIPTGFCYQRLTLGDTPETGYCIHALNAIYLSSHKKWIRLDARGNKEGIHAEFSIEVEKLAYSIREDIHEINYPTIYTKPHKSTMDVLRRSNHCIQMCMNELPTKI